MLPDAMLQPYECSEYLAEECEVTGTFKSSSSTSEWFSIEGGCRLDHCHEPFGLSASLFACAHMAVWICFRHSHYALAEV